MAHLKTKETRDNASERFASKLSIVRGLYEGGYTKEEILQLFRLIDWMMTLPKELSERFDNELITIEEEQRMPYITSIERSGIERGIERGSLQSKRESIIELLETRFSEVPSELRAVLNQIEDLEFLKQLFKRSITVASVEELQQLIPKDEGDN